jgi:hypothetical protein
LQANEQDDCRSAFEVERLGGTPEKARQLRLDDLQDLLRGGQGREDFLADGPLTDRANESFDDVQVDVCLEESRSDLLQCLIDMKLREMALATEFLENALDPVRK